MCPLEQYKAKMKIIHTLEYDWLTDIWFFADDRVISVRDRAWFVRLYGEIIPEL